MTRRPRNSLEIEAEASVWAGAAWDLAAANETMASVDAIERKLEIIDAARNTGLTWAELAESVRYGDRSDSNEATGPNDWVRAGKALQAWWAHHRAEGAEQARDAVRDAARYDREQAELRLDVMDDIVDALVVSAENAEAAEAR